VTEMVISARKLLKMPITQQDIADKVGVSRRLVSYALNGGASVNEETQNRILSVAAELGYKANRAAQTLVTGRTNQIALCVPTLSNPYHSEFIRHFEAFARHTSYDLLIITTLDKKNRLSKLAVDGMLIHHSSMSLPPDQIFCPMVVLQSPPSYSVLKTQKPFDQVLLDLSDASKAAMQHLLEQYPKRVAFVSFDGMLVNEPRYTAYEQAMRQANLPLEVILLNYSGKEALRPLSHKVLQEYFSKHGFPEVLFCCNDEVAIGAYRALRVMRREIPCETKVIGCDDISEIQDLYPALTSISHSWKEVCRSAWEMLMARIEQPDLPAKKISFQGQLVIRESSL
jgi:LacI family transcriptional regulator